MGRTDSLRGFLGLPGARGVAVAVLELALWWAAGTVFWLATASTVTASESLVAAAVSLVGAFLARLGRRAIPFAARPRRVWALWAALVPVAAAADMARLVRWLAGPQPDELREGAVPGSSTAADPVAAAGWRAAGIAALSATPGAVVIDEDPDEGTVLAHTLVQGWPQLDAKVLGAEAPRPKTPGVNGRGD